MRDNLELTELVERGVCGDGANSTTTDSDDDLRAALSTPTAVLLEHPPSDGMLTKLEIPFPVPVDSEGSALARLRESSDLRPRVSAAESTPEEITGGCQSVPKLSGIKGLPAGGDV